MIISTALVCNCTFKDVGESKLDTARIGGMFRDAWLIRSSDPNKAYALSKDALALSRERNYPKGIANALKSLSAVMVTKSKYDSAIMLADEAIVLFVSLNDIRGKAYATNIKGLAHNALGNFDQSAPLFETALRDFTSIDDLDGQSRAVNNLGITYFYAEDFEKALSSYLKCLSIREQLNDRGTLATALTNVGMVYRRMKNPDRALEYYQRALKVVEGSGDKSAQMVVLSSLGTIHYDKMEYEQSRMCHQKTLEISREVVDKQREALAYNNLGAIEQELGNYELAIKYYEKNISLQKEIGSKANRIAVYTNLSEIYRQMKMAGKAIDMADEMMRVAMSSDSDEDRMATYLAYAETYALTNDFKKAYFFFRKHEALKDSLFNEEKTRIIEDLGEQYESEKKNRQIETNEKQIAQLKAEKAQKNLLLVASVLFFVIISSVGVFWFLQHRGKIRKERLLSEKNKIIMELDLRNEKLKHELLQKEIAHKNRELVNLANFMVEKEEVIEDFAQQALTVLETTELSSAKGDDLQKLVRKIQSGLKLGPEREELMNHIRNVQESFYSRLEEQVPELSVNDRRLCALLRMNFSSKQIATVLNISPKSVDMSRYRLRKKLKVSSDQHLTEYLKTFG